MLKMDTPHTEIMSTTTTLWMFRFSSDGPRQRAALDCICLFIQFDYEHVLEAADSTSASRSELVNTSGPPQPPRHSLRAQRADRAFSSSFGKRKKIIGALSETENMGVLCITPDSLFCCRGSHHKSRGREPRQETRSETDVGRTKAKRKKKKKEKGGKNGKERKKITMAVCLCLCVWVIVKQSVLTSGICPLLS